MGFQSQSLTLAGKAVVRRGAATPCESVLSLVWLQRGKSLARVTAHNPFFVFAHLVIKDMTT